MLQVYNSLSRSLQEFVPCRDDRVGVYVCGPTVYGHSHIGHAKSYVSFDVVVRYLRSLGHRVRYVQNITDVGHLSDDADEGEDKVVRKAREAGLEPMEVAETYTRSYFEDMDALNVQRPSICPRASGHIPEQIEMVQHLLEKGHAYEVDGNVYFDITTFPDYGRLSGRSVEETKEGARVGQRTDKRHPGDFALWKRAHDGHIMRWNSPWGYGFPGWHLECSAMALKYLGPTLDIHGGGLENAFPHHENEIMQAEGVTGQPFVRYWLHNNMVTVDGQKMGKSLGNFVTLKDAFAGHPPLGRSVRPLVLRYFILGSHYRSPLDFSAEALTAAEKGLKRIEQAYSAVAERLLAAQDHGEHDAVPDAVQEAAGTVRTGFAHAMNSDFNTAEAIGELNRWTRTVNTLLNGDPGRAALEVMLRVYDDLGEDILGILRDARRGGAHDAAASTGRTPVPAHAGAAPMLNELVDVLVDTRNALREARSFDLADAIRDRLLEAGIELQDGAGTTRWKRR